MEELYLHPVVYLHWTRNGTNPARENRFQAGLKPVPLRLKYGKTARDEACNTLSDMRRCQHTNWLSLCTQENEVALLESNRLQTLTNCLPHPESQRPSLLVLVGNQAKSAVLCEAFGVKRTRQLSIRRGAGEIHLHLDPSRIFHSRPLLLADGDLPNHNLRARRPALDDCHEVIRRPIQGPREAGFSVHEAADRIYTHLLFPFTDIFCFFCADLGGLQQTARYIAAWFQKGHSSILSGSVGPKVVVITDTVPPHAEGEARDDFMQMLRESTAGQSLERIPTVELITLHPVNTVSADARHRHLKERLMDGSDQVRKGRQDMRTLYSANHLSAFLQSASRHFTRTDRPFNFLLASRVDNPIPTDLEEHLSNFLEHVRSHQQLTSFAAPLIASTFLLDSYPPDAHSFSPVDVFNELYKDKLRRASKARGMAEGQSTVPRGLVELVQNHLISFFDQFIQNDQSAAKVHRENLRKLRGVWSTIQSSSTCLCCLRRRPQYCLPCGHSVCENCVLIFADRCTDDPSIFRIKYCLLCGTGMTQEIALRIHPPTAGAGVLCIDGGGTRGIVPLTLMKRIQDRIGLPIPFQKFFKVAFGVSSGALIILNMFINGQSIDDSTKTFEKLAELAFKRRGALDVPLLSRLYELIASIVTDGLYPAKNIEAVLKEVFGADRSILDCSHATATGTKIGLPVATVCQPSLRIFTNYNGVGQRSDQEVSGADKAEGDVIRPKEGRVPLWEIARSVSAAPGFFPPKRVQNVGTFQDAGPLENDPLLTALFEVAALFPLIREPDFVVSLGTGESSNKAAAVNVIKKGSRKIWKSRAIPRICDLVLEKMRDRNVRRLFQNHPKYHRLNVEFDGAEPRLDDTKSMPELRSRVKADDSLSNKIDRVVGRMISSLFYFELESLPEMTQGKYVGTGHIYCTVCRSEPVFMELMEKLAGSSAIFLLDDRPVGTVVNIVRRLEKGGFRLRLELETTGRFNISLKQGDKDPCDISGSPFSIDKLVAAQGLAAHFGRADHGKRKRSWDSHMPARKRRRTGHVWNR